MSGSRSVRHESHQPHGDVSRNRQHASVVARWQRLAFYSDRDGGGIYTMNALGGDVRRVIPIKPGVLYTFSLAWSRDNSLVYTNFHDQGRRMFRIAPSGAPASCLTRSVVRPCALIR